MAVAFTLYEGFLIVEYSETDVKAYRSRQYYAGNTTSYETTSQANISQMIDDAGDEGDFTDVEYYELMQTLGRAGPIQYEITTPKYPTHIMDRVRQHLGLEPGDTSRDSEINNIEMILSFI